MSSTPSAWTSTTGRAGSCTRANAELYSDDGLESLAGLLRPGGRLAVWASAPDLEFERRLRERFAVVRTVTVDVARGPADVIYVASTDEFMLAEADGG